MVKKSLNIVTACIVLMFGVLMLSSCSSKNEKPHDTVTIEPDHTPELPKKVVNDVNLSPLGIGPIKTGMRISEIKPKVENLYDSIVRQGGYESNSYYFFLEGNQRFTVYEFDSGIVNVISADNRSVVVDDGNGGGIRVGDSFRKVLNLRDANSVWQSADGEGMWCWNWHGIWFVPEQEDLPDVLAHKLYNQTSAPRASDFPDDVQIGYIGTGLPW